MSKTPKQSTLARFKATQERHSTHSGEPIQDIGPSKVDIVKMLAGRPKVHGTVIRRLQKK